MIEDLFNVVYWLASRRLLFVCSLVGILDVTFLFVCCKTQRVFEREEALSEGGGSLRCLLRLKTFLHSPLPPPKLQRILAAKLSRSSLILPFSSHYYFCSSSCSFASPNAAAQKKRA